MSGCICRINAALTVRAWGALVGLTLLASPLAFGAPAVSVPSACWDKAMTQMQMNQCADADFRSADQSLNQVYRQMRSVAAGDANNGTPNSPDYLQAAQRAWLSYRDKECLSRTNGGPRAPGAGSMASMAYAICLTALTNARVADLQKQHACSEHDARRGTNENAAAVSDGSDASCSH